MDFPAQPDRPRPSRERITYRLKSLGHTPTRERVDAYQHALSGRCWICAGDNGEGRSLCLDHDHTTRQPRGPLCDRCNRALGGFRDDPARIFSAYRYLVAWKIIERVDAGEFDSKAFADFTAQTDELLLRTQTILDRL